ncbi:sphingomyelinase C precursor, putative [Entamoeba invadens IP1]|uniref:sphingomyelinase C precursor, putative n=1 Tax=Entamoeba invadens IP1 TaxID=370355 RepID=UPI0002C3F289|nr:sphingomyelinase C precursor, putative [Entamoeba invadens IP1]ELP93474.1 sphingomyelinase C precursor, putative [Entamoeba invadens IP1]|eukprot:XP_004260245.1 sphingomyelinase C precursor, putative [Entamoeba invadens IP1]
MAEKSESEVVDVENKPLRVLTYNMYLRPMLISANGHDHKNSRLKEFCRDQLATFDVICFQEVFKELNWRREKLLKKAKKAGFKWRVQTEKPLFPIFICDAGLIIISKYPIVYNKFKLYKRSIYADAVASKGALYAKIEVRPNQFLHIFNTHTQADYTLDYNEAKPSRDMRLSQIKQYAEFVKKMIKDDQYPVLLCGDFNVNGRAGTDGTTESTEYADLLKNLIFPDEELIDLLLRDNNGVQPVTFGDSFIDPSGVETPCDSEITYQVSCMDKSRLDYIFHLKRKQENPQMKCSNCRVDKFQVKGKKFPFMSDHYGVTCDVFI